MPSNFRNVRNSYYIVSAAHVMHAIRQASPGAFALVPGSPLAALLDSMDSGEPIEQQDALSRLQVAYATSPLWDERGRTGTTPMVVYHSQDVKRLLEIWLAEVRFSSFKWMRAHHCLRCEKGSAAYPLPTVSADYEGMASGPGQVRDAFLPKISFSTQECCSKVAQREYAFCSVA